MEQVYAQALWRAIENGLDVKKAVRSMHEGLKAHGREELMPRIARALKRLAERERARNVVVLTIAKEKDETRAKREAREALKEAGLEKRELEVRVDDSIIGGWHVEGAGVVVDRSWKSALLSMYNRVTKNL